jgi:4-amino-4-deoxy-L-arabinose transferase-like glycosyltransferase
MGVQDNSPQNKRPVGERIRERCLNWFSTRPKTVTMVGLGLIILLGAFLRFYQLGAAGVGNSYYAATVKSMLTSWHNFFFAAFEPGGSVTVDKPPLGFWVQAISAYFLGMNGFALALPQALAGVFSIPLLYKLVKRPFGVWAGLLAALVLAAMPVAVATERNNTIDGLLVFVLLLATWAVLKSVREGRFRYLLLGMFLVGLGFNIKMLQAYMVLPAFYALYFLGAHHGVWKRIGHLAAATVLMLIVSLSWAMVVDLTPAADRPYVGSSTDNSEMELIFDHNGVQRLSNQASINSGTLVGFDIPTTSARLAPRDDNRLSSPDYPHGQSPSLSSGDIDRAGNATRGPVGLSNGPGGAFDVGQPGWLRLFTQPLADQTGWLLPLALFAIPLILAVLGWKWSLTEQQASVVLWVGWLLPQMAYFSFTSGLWHVYYLIMLGPAIAALTAVAAWALWRLLQQRHWTGWVLIALTSGITLAFQLFTLKDFPQYSHWLTALTAVAWLWGIGLLAWRSQKWASMAGIVLMSASLLITPIVWSGLTTFSPYDSDTSLPKAGPSSKTLSIQREGAPALLSGSQQALVNYLLANTDPKTYLVGLYNADEATSYILATGRPVLPFGGFSGNDNVVNVNQLAQMVYNGDLRYVLDNLQLARSKPQIANWVTSNCMSVSAPGAVSRSAGQTFSSGGFQQGGTLYDCDTINPGITP